MKSKFNENSCNQTPTLSNIAEIVENKRLVKLSPLRSSKFITTFILIPHSAGVSKITRI